MEISLGKATIHDCNQIHQMQITGFKPLLNKYQDFETSPAAETLEQVRNRFKYPQTDHYFIQLKGRSIGYIRISKIDKKTCKLQQMVISTAYQEKGYAQQAIQQIEKLNSQVKSWVLDTTKQEKKLCYLYEKMGYQLTGNEKKIKDGMDLVDYAKQVIS